MSDQLIIFDTTLRDGEQSPGASMTRDEKVRIARQLERLRVDVIEAGFAAASPGDFDAVRAVAEAITESTVCSLARATEKDIRAAGEAIAPAKRRRIHTFIATSPIHMEKKLRMSPDQVVEAGVAAVKLALQYTDDVEFSGEDAVRSDLDFLVRIFGEVIRAGAKTINVPDTVGYSVPGQWGDRMKSLIERTPGADKVIWSTHCHNDLGMAVANSLSAVLGGARQVECTINGLGERAGNASLEEIVMAVKTRRDVFGCDSGVDISQIVPASRLVSQITGYPVQPNKAIVGANAFAHESGIHQDGVLKHRETYEIMRAEDVGWTANRIVLGKLSGRNAFRQRLSAIGIELESEQALNDAFARFKELADRKSEIFDEDLQALVMGDVETKDDRYRLLSLSQRSEMGERPLARVTFSMDGREVSSESEGNGPVDATVRAIEREVHSGAELLLFSVNAITTGTESQGEVTMRLSREGRVVNGMASDPDIVVASAKAYLNALNRLASQPRVNPQQP
ncbi:MAG: 2-isopropylmalate synthase [Betaproteobacteria bacterium]|nr:2-isopropylmalate synthase [Betaproteobacteria bacterium]NBY14071.1 2-isopropylmalate synthase [Betaproteobacteria bacterium]NCA15780.1 2-isopropylmalate synthase [Betaproteobacteria bacterium]NDF03757.1 2-isopropylmalate synthase [Betaproteobacteria bacterium]